MGDLVTLNDPWINQMPWLIVAVTKSKKTWHRRYVLYRHDVVQTYTHTQMKERFSRVVSQVPMVSP